MPSFAPRPNADNLNGRPVFFGVGSSLSTTAAVRVDFQRRETETYAPKVIEKKGGSFLSGRIVNYTPDGQILMRRPLDSDERGWPLYTLERSQIKRPVRR